MIYGSVCSGIEAASVAWGPLGWRCAFVSEIEPFPCRVLAHHYPDVPNRGDMTRYAEWPDDAIDVLVGGTPCQSFSVAGLRAGMADPRGNLALVFLGLIGRARPRWVVWENVPGVLSINSGRDFGSFLGGLGQLGYGWAYRVLDAQYFGVAQRRRRVFVVGHLGGWAGAGAVLFERNALDYAACPREEDGSCSHTIGTRVGQGSLDQIDEYEACGRLFTPLEVERLQGFPDGYTAIPGAKDSPRYKALGNSMAVPVMRWIGGRIEAVDALQREGAPGHDPEAPRA